MSALACWQQLTVQAAEWLGPSPAFQCKRALRPQKCLFPILLRLSVSDSAGIPLTIHI